MRVHDGWPSPLTLLCAPCRSVQERGPAAWMRACRYSMSILNAVDNFILHNGLDGAEGCKNTRQLRSLMFINGYAFNDCVCMCTRMNALNHDLFT